MVLVNETHGTFVYRALARLAVRSSPDVTDASVWSSGRCVEDGALVAVECIQPSRAVGSKNGPFLRLSNGGGWLFEKKHGEVMMRREAVQTGLWAFRVNNDDGLALRAYPTTSMEAYLDGR
eukprot:CAMPEP_0197598808 /NCGR_PEP_ID=MMETSP1326-20131121/30045_1 /TAXON_ID=1155430 /ORGANISM="Genus nov. species nov., Strain RCC2288" /LENGTH=120 /DNA_ID=CAMNT_0043165661 /DNA_START=85 /DNA_END=443 /DNA_ORIENTATION=+